MPVAFCVAPDVIAQQDNSGTVYLREVSSYILPPFYPTILDNRGMRVDLIDGAVAKPFSF